MNKKKQFDIFVQLIAKLEAIEFIGLAKILCVELVDNNKKIKDFYDIFKDMSDKFSTLGHKQRREIISILKQNNGS